MNSEDNNSDYLLHYKGELPKYADYCVNSILNNDSNSRVFLISENNYENLKVETINPNDLSKEFINDVIKVNYFKDNPDQLWITSLLRIFDLYNAAVGIGIKKFIHFDLDVLIYEPYDKLKHYFKENKLNITPESERSLIFGYSFIDGIENYKIVCETILNILLNAEFYEDKYYKGNKLNEMVLMNIAYIENPDLFHILETLPGGSQEIIFDGISYGQYLGGINNKKFSRKTINPTHFAGREMINKGFRPKFNSGKPEIIFDKKTYKLANLHIHKKSLKKYIYINEKQDI